jgi:hypothetical protein
VTLTDDAALCRPLFLKMSRIINMDRWVRQINVKAGASEEEKLRPFSAFSPNANLVLLGDPGAGKTHLFKEAAASQGGRWITARAFLVTPPDRLLGQDLFIDGLDEKRAGRGDRDTVDAMVEKLFAINPPKVRISCRAADWLGESDLKALRPFFEPNGDPPVVLLEKLSREEQRAVLTTQGMDAGQVDMFLAQAEERGLGDFLENPQNLIMLWRAVQAGHGQLPAGNYLSWRRRSCFRSSILTGPVLERACSRPTSCARQRAEFWQPALSVILKPLASPIRRARAIFLGIAA